ncbi:hypothetical protein N0V82_004765 [Gnomoniopsis sp. IMI 355080]|nr:hypothetical protein N0V82_004765 [Gnomoniopsis sp. IMI 355080]
MGSHYPLHNFHHLLDYDIQDGQLRFVNWKNMLCEHNQNRDFYNSCEDDNGGVYHKICHKLNQLYQLREIVNVKRKDVIYAVFKLSEGDDLLLLEREIQQYQFSIHTILDFVNCLCVSDGIIHSRHPERLQLYPPVFDLRGGH